jgi:hypothetical protein
MAETITVTDYSLVSDPEWERDLIKAKEKFIGDLIPPFIEFCKAVHTFRVRCDSSQGGSEFSKRGCELLGCSSTQLYHWSAVGLRAPELLGASNKLPISHDAIQRIASLDDVAFPKAIERLQPGMTNQQVRVLIKEVNPPIKRTEFEVDQKERNKAKRIIAEIENLQEEFRYLIWDYLNAEFKAREEWAMDDADKRKPDNRLFEAMRLKEERDKAWASGKHTFDILGIDKSLWVRLRTNDNRKKLVKGVFRRLASKNHPDKGGDAELMAKIQVAYDSMAAGSKVPKMPPTWRP